MLPATHTRGARTQTFIRIRSVLIGAAAATAAATLSTSAAATLAPTASRTTPSSRITRHRQNLVATPVAHAGPAEKAGIRLASGVGPFVLGTSRADVEQEFGSGHEVSDWYGATVRYPLQHVLVSYLVSTAFRVGTTWPGYHTPQGVGPGSTVMRLRQTYHRATCTRAARPFDTTCTVPAHSPASGPGLTYFYARKGVVREVDIWLVSE